ncbi:MAG TPA: protein-L-isoaspartate O-methyltransferase [Pelagibacterium sp.]|uniref:protein-L-isoaspartate O-methyltransferase family protein n=1 Tax=Pelagibacterium sp. TaxID=1967288 RepID=UPI002CBF3B00|nr:protein-L-isoaspartate O-methyltransferase [Pelagibacterium sp.]HWJ86627.1 protein-L-isoaspartate O-methyltransferase [Pelagibacterium sp.]
MDRARTGSNPRAIEDMVDYSRLRRTMVDNQLRTSDITDWRILDAMNRVPREHFVPRHQVPFAYSETQIELSPARAMPKPADFARLVQLADITSQDVVLDIACGTGYSTAVLSLLANAVVAVESDASLAGKANELLTELDIGNAAVVAGPIEEGVAREAPFDVIILEGAVDAVPPALFDQLRDGGKLVAVIGAGNAAVAHRYIRSGNDVAAVTSFNASLPVLGSFAPAPAFVF